MNKLWEGYATDMHFQVGYGGRLRARVVKRKGNIPRVICASTLHGILEVVVERSLVSTGWTTPS